MTINSQPHVHQALVNKAKLNDQGAQSQLYGLYYKAIYNSSLRIVGDQYTAEDIMQDAFIDGFKKIKQFKSESTFGAWIKKIAINKSIDYLKKKQLIADKLEDYTAINEDTDEEEFYSVEMIKSAMRSLSPSYKTIFSLFMIEGYDHEEISEIMGISQSTSRSQLTRAKMKLKKIIEQNTLTSI